jgi:hypothetical protein
LVLSRFTTAIENIAQYPTAVVSSTNKGKNGTTEEAGQAGNQQPAGLSYYERIWKK